MIAIRPTPKSILLGLIAVIILTAIGLGAWLLWPKSSINGGTMPVSVVSVDEVAATALNYSAQNDVAGGLAYYDDQIKNHTDVNEKYQLLLYKSGFAVKAKQYDLAITVAKQADSLKKDTPAAAVTIADAYKEQGNKEQARTYYQKAINLLPQDDAVVGYRDMLKQEVRELE